MLYNDASNDSTFKGMLSEKDNYFSGHLCMYTCISQAKIHTKIENSLSYERFSNTFEAYFLSINYFLPLELDID